MSRDPYLTEVGMRVLRFAEQRPSVFCGADLYAAGFIGRGTVYPLLRRYEAAGWLSSAPERGDARQLGRPLRRFYEITEAGRLRLAAALRALAGEEG